MNLSDPVQFVAVAVGVALSGYGVFVFLRTVIAQGIAEGLKRERQQQEKEKQDRERQSRGLK